jgi:hypothetical protein
MKRSIALVLVALLAAAAMAGTADAGKKRKKRKKVRRIERVAELGYDAPAPGIPSLFRGGNCGSPNTGCAEFTSLGRERYVKIEIEDTNGQAVYAEIISGDQLVDRFCGSNEALKIGGSATFTVWVQAPPDPTVCPAPATAGTVTATFSNLP